MTLITKREQNLTEQTTCRPAARGEPFRNHQLRAQEVLRIATRVNRKCLCISNYQLQLTSITFSKFYVNTPEDEICHYVGWLYNILKGSCRDREWLMFSQRVRNG